MWWARFWKWLCSLCSCGRNPAPSTSSTIQVHEKRPTLSDFKRDVKAIATSQREAKKGEAKMAHQAKLDAAAKEREESQGKTLLRRMEEQRNVDLVAQRKRIEKEKARKEIKQELDEAESKRRFDEMLDFMNSLPRQMSPSLLVFNKPIRKSFTIPTIDTTEPTQSGCRAWFSSKIKYCCACFFREKTSQPTPQPVHTPSPKESGQELKVKQEKYVTLDGRRVTP